MMIGTPKTPHATRVLMLGSGELGKEVVIELQRFGVEVIACDRYADAPAMQVAHRNHVIDMLDRASLRAVVEREKPHLIVPEIEAIATPELQALEREGWHVIPTAEDRKSTRLNSSHVSISYAVFCLKKTTSSFCAAPFIDQKSALAT